MESIIILEASMTREEFISRAANQVHFYNVEDRGGKELFDHLCEKCNGANMDFLFNFLYKNGFKGSIMFLRYENRSDDRLCIRICGSERKTFFWADINQYVSLIATISNYTCKVEEFYISQDGRFWDEYHKLRFQNEEELFDYLMTVEYDFHPVISEKTFEMLHHFGWYEGRRVDTSEFEQELKKRNITLSQIQLDAIREFSGLSFLFSRQQDRQEFYSLDYMIEMLNDNDLHFESEIYDFDHKNLVGKNVLEIGTNDMQYFSISLDGKIFIEGDKPVSRTVLEYIYSFCEHLPENVAWL